MAKLTTSPLDSLANQTSAIATINSNFAAVETAMEKTLSRDGTSPDSMSASLDMNSHTIINLPDGITEQEPATVSQLNDLRSDFEDTETLASAALLQAVEDAQDAVTDVTALVVSAAAHDTSAGVHETNAETAQTAAEDARDDAIAAAASVTRKTIYVDSVNGNDSNTGLASDDPVLTLAHAVSLLSTDDNLRLARGSFWREDLEVSNLGHLDIRAYGAGELPIISGRNILDNASFSLYSGNTYTVTISLTAGSASVSYPGFFEDGIRLTEYTTGEVDAYSTNNLVNSAACIAAVDANPGSFYFAGPGTHIAGWSSGTKTYYVHPFGSTDPTSDDKVYEAYKREYTLRSIDCDIADLRMYFGWSHTGFIGQNYSLTNVYIHDFARQAFIDTTARITDCAATMSNPHYIGNYFHADRNNVSVTCPRYKNCRAIGNPDLLPLQRSNGYFCHGDGGDNEFPQMIYDNCSAYNINLAFFPASVNDVYIHGGEIRGCVQYLYLTAANGTIVDGVDWADGNDRPILLAAALPLEIRNSLIKSATEEFFFASSPAGDLTINDSTFIFQGSTDGVYAYRHVVNLNSGSTTMNSLTVNRSEFYAMGGKHTQFFAGSALPSTYSINDCVIGFGDQTYPLNNVGGTEFAVEGVDGVNRLVLAAPDKVFNNDAGYEKPSYKLGVYKPGTYRFNSITFSGSGIPGTLVFVAVGDIIAYNTSGQVYNTFFNALTPSSEQNAVTYDTGSTRFISVGRDGTIYRSNATIGSTWSVITSGVIEHLNAVAVDNAGNGVIVGNNGTILFTDDSGATWTEAGTPDTSAHLYGVAWNGTTWVAVGNGGKYVTSTDMDTWSESTLSVVAGGALWCVTWADDLTLFISGGDGGAIYTSADGASWTLRTSNTQSRIRCVKYDTYLTNKVYAGIERYYMYGPDLITSTNGTTWTSSKERFPFQIKSISAFDGFHVGMIAVGHTDHAAQTFDGEFWITRRIVSRPSTMKDQSLPVAGILQYEVT